MKHQRSAIKTDLFADQYHMQALDKLGDPLVELDVCVDFAALAAEVDCVAPRPAPYKVVGRRIPWLEDSRYLNMTLLAEQKEALREEVRRLIDLLAFYKINRLHLHLTDDQGWRIEIRSWPNLALHGGSTQVDGGPGGYYTQQEYADQVAYAQSRYITVAPEIDMPGHTNAVQASYLELNCDGIAPPLYTGTESGFSSLCSDKEVTYRFVDDVVGEIAALTPDPYFHIGGDEAFSIPLSDNIAFVKQVERIVQAHGKVMIGTDEFAQAPLLPTSVAKVWRYRIYPDQADIDWMTFPRIIGYAEIGWSPACSRRWKKYRIRLGRNGPRLEALGVDFYRFP